MVKALKIFPILFVFVFTTIILSCCRADGNHVVIRFSWWGEKERHDGTLAAIDIWNGKNTGIIVEPWFSGWYMYHEELDAMFARNDAPDVFQFSTDFYEIMRKMDSFSS